MRKIELLVPASSLEVLKIVSYFREADAVYIGGEVFRASVPKRKTFPMRI